MGPGTDISFGVPLYFFHQYFKYLLQEDPHIVGPFVSGGPVH